MRNLVLLAVAALTVTACSSGWPDTGTVWIRNETTTPVNVEVVTSTGVGSLRPRTRPSSWTA